MINTYVELRNKPEDTLRRMIADALAYKGDIGHLEIGEPIVVDGKTTKVSVSVDRTVAPVEYWQFTDEQEFTFERLDIQELFGDYVPTFSIPEYVSTSALFKRLTKETGLVFTTRDIYPIIVQPSTVLVDIPVSPSSYRYVGQFKARLLLKR